MATYISDDFKAFGMDYGMLSQRLFQDLMFSDEKQSNTQHQNQNQNASKLDSWADMLSSGNIDSPSRPASARRAASPVFPHSPGRMPGAPSAMPFSRPLTRRFEDRLIARNNVLEIEVGSLEEETAELRAELYRMRSELRAQKEDFEAQREEFEAQRASFMAQMLSLDAQIAELTIAANTPPAATSTAAAQTCHRKSSTPLGSSSSTTAAASSVDNFMRILEPAEDAMAVEDEMPEIEETLSALPSAATATAAEPAKSSSFKTTTFEIRADSSATNAVASVARSACEIFLEEILAKPVVAASPMTAPRPCDTLSTVIPPASSMSAVEVVIESDVGPATPTTAGASAERAKKPQTKKPQAKRKKEKRNKSHKPGEVFGMFGRRVSMKLDKMGDECKVGGSLVRGCLKTAKATWKKIKDIADVVADPYPY